MVLTRRLNVERRRWLGLTVLVLTASALIPAALALACNPQAYLTIDKAQYAPGDSVRVSGSFFKADRNITLSVDRTGQSATVKTTANGAFQATFALPSGAATGGYSVQAIGFEPDTGDVTPGLPARGSFSVAAAQAAPAPSTAGGNGQSAPQASQPAAQAGQPAASQAAQPPAPQAAKPAQRPATGQPSPGYREPSVFNEPDVQSSGTPRSTTSRDTSTTRSQRTTSRGTAPQSDTAIANGRPVFGGSVAPAVSASAFAPAPATAATDRAATDRATSAARPSRAAAPGKPASPGVTPGAAEQTAADDVWSAVSSDRSPSVMPIAGDGVAVSSPSAGSQLAVGLLLVGAGVALVGGLAVAATRRRVRVR